MVEELLHLSPDFGVVDALLGPEHDRPDHAGPLPAEFLVEDVEAVLRLDVGQVELVTERTAGRAREHAAEHERGDPDPEDELAVIVGPGTEACEHESLL